MENIHPALPEDMMQPWQTPTMMMMHPPPAKSRRLSVQKKSSYDYAGERKHQEHNQNQHADSFASTIPWPNQRSNRKNNQLAFRR